MPGGDPAHDAVEATSAGLYGLIVGASVTATAQLPSAVGTVVAVLLTLVIYWAAERYARIVAERVHKGHRPGWSSLRAQLTGGWELVTTSLLPLVVLVVVQLSGSGQRAAAFWALVTSTVLLSRAGWRIGRDGRMTRPDQIVSALLAGLFGVLLIGLKMLLH